MDDESKRNDDSLIAKISYLASLASKPQEIDPFLDPLRSVTARLAPNTTLSAEDKVTLQTVHAAIEGYLLNNDPLRTFTKEQLDQMLDRQFGGQLQPQMKKHTASLLVGAWGISIAAATLAYATGSWLSSEEKRSLFSSVVFIAAIFVAAATFNALAVKKFKPELRQAYAYICTGILVAGIASAQFPIIEMVDQLGGHILFKFGGFTPAFILACALFLVGAMRFARILSIRLSPLLIPLVIAATPVAVVAAILAPHPALTNTDRAFFDLANASLFICTVLLAATAWVLQKVISQLAIHYANAVKWFLSTMVIMALACTVRGVWILATEDMTSLWSNILFMVGSVLILQAGYKFYRAANDR